MASYNPPNDDNPIFNTFNFMSDSIYQTIAGMTIYLTKTVAASTYQTIANMTNYVNRTGSVTEDITGTKTFTGTIKSNNYDTQTATAALTIGSSVTSGDINIGRNKTSGYIGIGSGFGQLSVYCSTALKATSIEIGSDFNVRNIVSSDPSSTNHALFTNMITNGVLTIGNALSSNIINGASTFNQAITASGTLKTTSIVPITPNAQHELFYNTLGATGTLFIGTAGRTMNLYGNANFSTNCQVSGDFKTDDITAINNASTQNIYTTLTTSNGIINLGASTVNTVTNIRGGSISIGGSTNTLTIESPTTFNNALKTTSITPITASGVQSIYTNLTSMGTIDIGSTTTGTVTNILGGEVNIIGTSPNLIIKNNLNTGSIKLQTSNAGNTLDSLILDYTKCNILPPTLNLTASAPIYIEAPNNLTGTINLFSTVTSGDIKIAGGLTTGFVRLGQDNTTCKVNIFSRILLGTNCYSFPGNIGEMGYYNNQQRTLLSTAYTTPNYQNLSNNIINRGVYRIDWSVTTNTTTTGVHSGYDFVVSTTSGGSTPVPFVGSQLKTHFGGTYAIGQKIVVGSSFTYQSTTTSLTLYLNISSSYASPWAGNWVGDIAFTRIA